MFPIYSQVVWVKDPVIDHIWFGRLSIFDNVRKHKTSRCEVATKDNQRVLVVPSGNDESVIFGNNLRG